MEKQFSEMAQPKRLCSEKIGLLARIHEHAERVTKSRVTADDILANAIKHHLSDEIEMKADMLMGEINYVRSVRHRNPSITRNSLAVGE